jgi:ribosomal protein S18 acetylase RimI-like enzyme
MTAFRGNAEDQLLGSRLFLPRETGDGGVADSAYRVDVFDEAHAAPAVDLARLHTSLLPESPIPLLGTRFMERYYYSSLPRAGAIRGAVAYVDRAPAGFIAVAADPGFMSAALRRDWLRIGWLIGTSVLANPKRLVYVWEALQLMRVGPSSSATAAGQILSFGVLPVYRDLRFVRRTGLRIGVDLLKSGIHALRERGVREIRAAVHRDNLEAQLFYRGQGWRVTRRGLPGWRVPAVELAWSADSSVSAEPEPTSVANRP